MFAAFSRYMSSLKYTPIGQASDASDGSATRFRIPTFRFRFFNSKRLVILVTAILFVFLLVSFHLIGPNALLGVSRGRPSTFGFQKNVTSDVNWSRFAYTQYATNAPYLCNSVMLFEILHRLGSKADRLLMYPSSFKVSNSSSDESHESLLLKKARDEYNVKLSPIEIVQRNSNDPTWAESYTKLLAFNQTQYDRVLNLDSDSTVLQVRDLMP